MSRDHPRTRGKHSDPEDVGVLQPGSPPHTREAHRRLSADYVPVRITPAHAGSTVCSQPCDGGSEDHPRTRGKHHGGVLVKVPRTGSPPHTREAHPNSFLTSFCGGITPAHAGSTRPSAPQRRKSWDHPRTRGKHVVSMAQKKVTSGSPPHTREAQALLSYAVLRFGITPAHAGSTVKDPQNSNDPINDSIKISLLYVTAHKSSAHLPAHDGALLYRYHKYSASSEVYNLVGTYALFLPQPLNP